MDQRRFRAVRAITVLAGAAALALALGACSGGPGGASDDPNRELLIVGIPKTLDNPGYAVARNGAEKRIEELGGNIKLEWVAPTGADPAKQVQLIESYVQRGADGIFVSALGPSVCNAIDQAIAAGVKVTTFDSDCPDSTRLSYVGSDNFEGGYQSGLLYADSVKGKGHQRIAILTGVVGAVNLGERDAGFKKALEDEGVDFEVVTTVAGNDDLTKSVEAVESTLRGDATINGFFFDGPWPLLVERSNLPTMIDRIGSGDLTVVSFDTIQPELPWVSDGLVVGLVGQKYYGWGYQSIQVLNGIIRDGATFGELADTGIDIVTKDGGDGRFTVAEMNDFWDSGQFNEEPIQPKS
jgi:ribose transport system substrate-binding protein